jgi:hypothetical protein
MRAFPSLVVSPECDLVLDKAPEDDRHRGMARFRESELTDEKGKAMIKLAFLASFTGLSLADPALARMITFDNLPDTSPHNRIPNLYDGFDWSPHFLYLNGADYLYPSGYRRGVVSAPNVAFNGGGRSVSFSSSMPFELDSFYLTAAWRKGLKVTVTGELDGVVVDSTTLTVNPRRPTLETFNWDVDTVVFQSFGGAPGLFSGFQFVLDNLSVSPISNSSIRSNSFGAIPELSTRTLMLLGFAGLGGAAILQRARRIGFAVTPFGVPRPLATEYPPRDWISRIESDVEN